MPGWLLSGVGFDVTLAVALLTLAMGGWRTPLPTTLMRTARLTPAALAASADVAVAVAEAGALSLGGRGGLGGFEYATNARRSAVDSRDVVARGAQSTAAPLEETTEMA